MDGPAIDQQVTFLATRDLEAATAFYEGVLELPLVLDQGVCSSFWILLGHMARPQSKLKTLILALDHRYRIV